MKKHIRIFAAAVGVAAIVALASGLMVARLLPDSFSVTEGQKLSIDNFPVITSAQGAVQASTAGNGTASYRSDLRLFNLIELKNVRVNVVKETDVVPDGRAFGVKLYTEGVMVIGMTDVNTAQGLVNPASQAGIRKGDILVAINGKTVNSYEEVTSEFAKSGGKSIKLSLKRNGTAYETEVKPVTSADDGTYKVGMMVRDSTAGIGTITYYDPQSCIFGGLGHGISDVDTGEIMPLMTGQVVQARITGIIRGEKGRTGELEGTLGSNLMGSLYVNTQTGVFGVLNDLPADGKAIPVAMRQQVCAGAAKILVTLDDSGPKSYSIRIEKVSYDGNAPTKNMVIRVTDPALIAKTGGIVQGMSGSPIIQNGRLVGAVTHVFVNDSSCGYGIFAENMINTVKNLENEYTKDVS